MAIYTWLNQDSDFLRSATECKDTTYLQDSK